MLPVIASRPTKTLVRSIRITIGRFSKISSTQGIPGLVKYLKAVSVMTQQSIAGYKADYPVRISRTKSGIPRVFPVFMRRLIRQGNVSYMRLALTLSSLYRDFIYDSPVNIDTIIKPFSGNKRAVDNLKGYIPNFVNLFIAPQYSSPAVVRSSLKDKFLYIPISKASPQSEAGFSSTNPFTLIRSALAMPKSIISSLRTLTGIYENTRFINLLESISLRSFSDPVTRVRHPYVGKLGLKQEAAGKMRVFAMVDP